LREAGESLFSKKVNMTTTGTQGEVKPRIRESNGMLRASELKDVPPGEEDLTVGQPYDPLDELLNLDPNRVIEEEVDMSPHFTRPWRVKALSNELNAQLLERATRYRENPRTHEQIRQFDNVEFSRLIVAYCVVEPNLMDTRVFQKHNVDKRYPDRLVAKILLPGQIDRLAGVITRISGFRDDLVTVAKNSSDQVD
jgi:XkdN-like tail assembly chaperone